MVDGTHWSKQSKLLQPFASAQSLPVMRPGTGDPAASPGLVEGQIYLRHSSGGTLSAGTELLPPLQARALVQENYFSKATVKLAPQ